MASENVELKKKLELQIKDQAEYLYESSVEASNASGKWNIIHGKVEQEVYQFLVKYIMSRNTNFVILNENDLTFSVICSDPKISKALLDSISLESPMKPSRFIKIQLNKDQFSVYLKILK